MRCAEVRYAYASPLLVEASDEYSLFLLGDVAKRSTLTYSLENRCTSFEKVYETQKSKVEYH